MNVEKPSRAMYSEYSGEGTVVNAIAARKVNAISQKAAPVRRALVGGRDEAGAAATREVIDISTSSHRTTIMSNERK
jgi:hypothetical protein